MAWPVPLDARGGRCRGGGDCQAAGESATDRHARLWDYCDIAWYARCGHSTAEAYTREDDFPAPLRLPGRLVRWRGEDVVTWFATRAAGSGAARSAEANNERARSQEQLLQLQHRGDSVPVPRRFSGAGTAT